MVGFTGLGSLPGTDLAAALRMTFEAVPALPYLPELPARGPWAGLIGRGYGAVGALPAGLEAGEWRLTDTPGRDQRRARATWRDDLDQLEEMAHGYAGPFTVTVVGPWTMAASTGVAHTGRVLADPGARRDLGQAHAEAVAGLLADVIRRLPGIEPRLQVDEPCLPAVAAGAVPTPGGYFRHRRIDLPELLDVLGLLVAELRRHGVPAATVLHSCAPWPDGWPLDRLLSAESQAGFDAISLDIDQLAAADIDALAVAIERGAGFQMGCLPTLGPQRPVSVDAVRRRALAVLERIGVGPDAADRIVLTPACGLAGWQPSQAGRAFEVLSRAAEQVEAELS